MKECHLKNIIGGIFFTLIIFLGSFSVKAEKVKIPNLEDSLVGTQRAIYNSLSLSSQDEIKYFYYNLGDTLQKRNHRHNRENDFVEFLRRVDSFLNSEIDQQVRAKKAYIIGIANLEDGSYIVNVRHLKVFTLKCKSSINGGFAKIGYCPAVKNREDNRIQTFFGSLLENSNHLLRQWTIRTKLHREPSEILPSAPMPENLPPLLIFPDVNLSAEGINFSGDQFILPDFRQDIDSPLNDVGFSFDDYKNI